MPQVFVPMQPARLDPDTRVWIPTINLKPAERWGEIKIIFHQRISRTPLGETIRLLRDKMSDYTPNDYLCAVGDPALTTAAAFIAAAKGGEVLRLLRWDRQACLYHLVEIPHGYHVR